MKSIYSSAILLILSALSSVGHAQVVYTASGPVHHSGYIAGFALIQTFSGFTELTEVSWTVSGSDGAAETFALHIAEWDRTTNRMSVGGSITQFGASVSSDGESGSLEFSDTWFATDPTKLYGLVLTQTSSMNPHLSASVQLTPADSSADFFASGTGSVVFNHFNSASLADELEGPANSIFPNDVFAMSVTGTMAAIPEPATTTLWLTSLSMAVIVSRRLLPRRKASASVT